MIVDINNKKNKIPLNNEETNNNKNYVTMNL